MVPSAEGDDLQVHAMPLVLSRVEGPADRDPVDGDQGAVQDHERQLVPLRGPQRSSQLRRAGRQQRDRLVHIRQAVAVLTANRAARSANVSPLRR